MGDRSLLTVEQVSHRFGVDEVLAAVSFELDVGRTLALVGPSGCGKTTLLRLAGGLIEPSAGSVVNRAGRTAFMFQEPRLLPWKRVGDNIALGLRALDVGRAECARRTAAAAEQVGLDPAQLTRFPDALSGGMRQRVALARALVTRPDLLLLDEPFSALDVGLRRSLQRFLIDAGRDGVAQLLVTHDLREALRLGDALLVMASGPGRVVYASRPERPPAERDGVWIERRLDDLLTRSEVRQAFALDRMSPT